MVSPSFVDQGPKSRVLIIAIGDCPEMAQIWLGGGKPPPATTSRCHMATLPFHDVEEVLVIFDTGWRCSSAVQHWMHWINRSSSFSGMLVFVFVLPHVFVIVSVFSIFTMTTSMTFSQSCHIPRHSLWLLEKKSSRVWSGGRFVMGINIPTIFVRMLSSHLFMLLKLL